MEFKYCIQKTKNNVKKLNKNEKVEHLPERLQEHCRVCGKKMERWVTWALNLQDRLLPPFIFSPGVSDTMLKSSSSICHTIPY